MEKIIRKYPAKKEQNKWIFTKEYSPDFVMDLHGFTQRESEKKLEWIREKSNEEKWGKIKIITGKGSGVLFSFIFQKIKSGFFSEWNESILENNSGFEFIKKV